MVVRHGSAYVEVIADQQSPVQLLHNSKQSVTQHHNAEHEQLSVMCTPLRQRMSELPMLANSTTAASMLAYTDCTTAHHKLPTAIRTDAYNSFLHKQ
jgi:hypothetical protein